MESSQITLDATSHTFEFVKWLAWFEQKHGFVPTRVKIQRGLMQAICWENGMPTNLSEYGIIGVAMGVIPDA